MCVYAIGVNPARVRYVVQQGQCNTDEALQKLGRTNRQTHQDDAVFFWTLDACVYGERQSQTRQPKYPGLAVQTTASVVDEARREASQRLYRSDGSDSDISVVSAYSVQSSLSTSPAPGSKRKRGLRRHPPDSYHWREIMRLYENDHNVLVPCNNSSRCVDSPVVLEDLPADERVENKDVRITIERELEKLVFTLSNEITCSILVTARPDPTERVLSLA